MSAHATRRIEQSADKHVNGASTYISNVLQNAQTRVECSQRFISYLQAFDACQCTRFDRSSPLPSYVQSRTALTSIDNQNCFRTSSQCNNQLIRSVHPKIVRPLQFRRVFDLETRPSAQDRAVNRFSSRVICRYKLLLLNTGSLLARMHDAICSAVLG